MLQPYDITVPVNKPYELNAPGEFVYYLAGNAGGADTTVKLQGISSGLTVLLKPGQAYRLPAGKSETAWRVINSANAQTIIGLVLVGDGDFTDNRISGTVEVIDGGKNRSLANSAFAGATSVSSVAGNYSLLQLFNPAGSGKRAVVEQVAAGIVTADGVGFWIVSTTQTGLGACSPKLGGGVASSSVLQGATVGARPAGTPLINIVLPANGWQTFKLSEPIVLPPGFGLAACPGAVNNACSATFEFYEEANQ